MANQTLAQIYVANPIATLAGTEYVYLGQTAGTVDAGALSAAFSLPNLLGLSATSTVPIKDSTNAWVTGGIAVVSNAATASTIVGRDASGDTVVRNLALATATATGATTTAPGFYAQITGDTFARVSLGTNAADIARIGFGPGNAARDLFLQRAGAATLRFGDADAASPVAQIATVQGVVTGTSNTAGALWTFKDSVGTGTGASGGFAWQTAAAGSSGSTPNTQTTKLALSAAGVLTLTGTQTTATGTITTSQPAHTITQDWSNAGVTFTGFLMNITNTNSNVASMFADMQVGGVSQFQIQRTGIVDAMTSAGGFRVNQSNGATVGMVNGRLFIGQSAQISFSSGASAGAFDAGMRRTAANTIGVIGNTTTTAQVLQVYRTTDSGFTNYERLALQSGSGYFEVASETAGTGTDDIDLRLTPSTTVAAVDFRNPANGAAAQVGTLTNAPSAGNPAYWLKIKIAGTTHYIPAWT